jgi:hypothetical protein
MVACGTTRLAGPVGVVDEESVGADGMKADRMTRGVWSVSREGQDAGWGHDGD